jgi:hypothetical protein
MCRRLTAQHREDDRRGSEAKRLMKLIALAETTDFSARPHSKQRRQSQMALETARGPPTEARDWLEGRNTRFQPSLARFT